MLKRFRLITKNELERVNEGIAYGLGSQNRIVCGSCEQLKRGKIRYHITINNSNAHKSSVLLEKIGKHVIRTLGGDEVYYLGTKIACT